MNVIICTPGRFIQHLQESPGFFVDNLQMLVIDEADMIMELGFQSSMNYIIKQLPRSRQTLVYSATLSKDIQALGKLSLKSPERIFLHSSLKNQEKSSISDMYETSNKLT